MFLDVPIGFVLFLVVMVLSLVHVIISFTATMLSATWAKMDGLLQTKTNKVFSYMKMFFKCTSFSEKLVHLIATSLVMY